MFMCVFVVINAMMCAREKERTVFQKISSVWLRLFCVSRPSHSDSLKLLPRPLPRPSGSTAASVLCWKPCIAHFINYDLWVAGCFFLVAFGLVVGRYKWFFVVGWRLWGFEKGERVIMFVCYSMLNSNIE